MVNKLIAARTFLALGFITVMCLAFSGLGDMGSIEAASGIKQKPKLPQMDQTDRSEIVFRTFLTGYSYWDNTPKRSANIAKPVIHKKAGGVGTFEDPITLAVGHRLDHGIQTMDFPAGTRFYFPSIRKYAIVEDVCGDGRKPQNGPCHIGYEGYPWLDIYVGGRSGSASAADACMRSITGVQNAIMNPRNGYPVIRGEIFKSNCS